MGTTVNYHFPTYDEDSAPDLTGAYNTAVGMIDSQIKSNETAASEADRDAAKAQSDVNALAGRVTALENKAGDFNPKETDSVITVAQLAAMKVTDNGIVYFKQA